MSCYESIQKVRKSVNPGIQKSGYVEFHARSAFSFLEGASLPEDLFATCVAHQMPAMALLYRDVLYGSLRFHLPADKARIQAPIEAVITTGYPLTNCQF